MDQMYSNSIEGGCVSTRLVLVPGLVENPSVGEGPYSKDSHHCMIEDMGWREAGEVRGM